MRFGKHFDRHSRAKLKVTAFVDMSILKMYFT